MLIIRGATLVRLVGDKKFSGDEYNGNSQPHSLRVQAQSAIPFTLITVASPAQATADAFAWQLRGPFGAVVWAGSHLSLLSVPPVQRLLVLFKVFKRSIERDYKRITHTVKAF